MGSCSNEFSEYEKNGITDLESNELRRSVKEVTTFLNGEISSKESYNKWGFYSRREKYENGELSVTREYEYDKKGLLVKEISSYNNGDKRIDSYFYDEKGNPTKSTYYEIIDGKKNSEQFIASYDNTYDENGNLIKVIEKDSSTTPVGNYNINYYNLGGKIVRTDRVDEQGRTRAFMAFEYNANGELYKSIFLYGDGRIRDYWEEVYNPNSSGGYNKPYKRRHIWPDEPNNYFEQNIQYNDKGDRIVSDNGGDSTDDYKYTYQYDENDNWILKRTEGLRTEVYFIRKNGETQPFSEEKRELEYY